VTELNGLQLNWLSVPVSKQSKHFDELNIAVTQRMTRLQLPPTNSTMNQECLEHFYPTGEAASNKIGYRALSIQAVKAIFVATFALLFFSVVVVLAEMLFARLRQVDQTKKIDKSKDLQVPVNEFVLKFEMKFRNEAARKGYISRMKPHHMDVCEEFRDSIY
jgi:hypothetical protein